MSSIFKGIFGGASAAEEAGEVQERATERGIARTEAQFQQTRADLAPFREAGLPALSQFQALLGLGDPGAQEAAQAALVETPGQQFIRKRAQRNLLQNAAAIGGLGGGNVRSALVEQGAGFGAQDLQNQFARLQSLIGGGQGAAAQTGQFGQLATSNIADLLQSGGQARASGILGAQQARAGMVGNIANIAGLGLSLFSDERVKEDIQDLDLEACFNAVMEMPLKSWRYMEEMGLGSDCHIGPMAQSAPDMIRLKDMGPIEMLDLHDELNMIAGALQYMKDKGMLICH